MKRGSFQAWWQKPENKLRYLKAILTISAIILTLLAIGLIGAFIMVLTGNATATTP